MAAKTVSLSVPEEMAARAKELGIDGWSALLQDALRREIMIEEAKQVSDIEGGLARLRASKVSNAGLQQAEGEGDGKEWALEKGEADEVQRIAELLTNNPSFCEDPDNAWNDFIALHMAWTGDGNDRPDSSRITDMFYVLFGNRRPPSLAYLLGWVTGVSEINDMI